MLFCTRFVVLGHEARAKKMFRITQAAVVPTRQHRLFADNGRLLTERDDSNAFDSSLAAEQIDVIWQGVTSIPCPSSGELGVSFSLTSIDGKRSIASSVKAFLRPIIFLT